MQYGFYLIKQLLKKLMNDTPDPSNSHLIPNKHIQIIKDSSKGKNNILNWYIKLMLYYIIHLGSSVLVCMKE